MKECKIMIIIALTCREDYMSYELYNFVFLMQNKDSFHCIEILFFLRTGIKILFC